MASHLIGVLGKKRHGKDTFAERLVESHGFTRIAFADALRNVLFDLDPLVSVEDDEVGPLLDVIEARRIPGDTRRVVIAPTVRLAYLVNLVGWDAAKATREVRRLMQEHGVAVRSHVDSETWVRAALVKARDVEGPVVITDVRFPNEAEAVTAYGGSLVRVYRPGMPADDLHVSETALDDYRATYDVENGGTVADLHDLADGIASAVLS